MNHIKNTNRLVLFIIIWYLIFSGLLSYLISKSVLNIESIYLNIILHIICFIIPCIIYIFITKSDFKEILRLNKITFIEIIACIGFSFFIIPLVGFINVISSFFVKNHITTALQDFNNFPFIIVLFVTAIMPAFSEEFLTRGIIYHSYKKTNILKGALLSSLIFGIIHMNINQFLYAFVLGFIFVLLIEATDSIYSSMIVHFVINATSVVVMRFTKEFQKTAEIVAKDHTLTNILSSFFLTLVFTPIAFFIFYSLAQYNGRYEHIKNLFTKKEKIKEYPNKTKLITWHIYICLGIFIIISILMEIAPYFKK